MSFRTTQLFKRYLPGAGRDTSANPVQGKTQVVGLFYVTGYEGVGGESLTPQTVGLSVIDAIDLNVQTPNTAGVSTVREAVVGANSFYLVDVANTGARTNVAATTLENVQFVAYGDSLDNVELT